MRWTHVALMLAAIGLGPEAVSEEAVPEESLGLGFCWAPPGPAATGTVDRTIPLAGLPGAFVLTTPIAWGSVEPEAPKNRRPGYRWDDLDGVVRSAQGVGLSPVLVLTTGSPWACVPPEACEWPKLVRKALDGPTADLLLRQSRGATPPKADAWAQWERYVEELVERYDGDGILDMKGLEGPVRHVQVLDRAQDPDRWLGSAEDYLRLLHHADAGGHRAFEGLRLVHAAVDFHGLGRAPFPDATEMGERRRRHVLTLTETARLEVERALAFSDRTLEMPRLFQCVGVLGSGHFADEDADLRYARHLLDQRGGTAVEVWLEASPARKHDDPAVSTPSVPSRDEQALRRRWLPVASSPSHADHAAARRWLETGVAFDLVRTATLARLSGARRALVTAISEPARAEDLVVERASGGFERAPSWHAARQWIRRTSGSNVVRELAAGSEAKAVVFEFPTSHVPRWEIVLLRDPNRSWAGDPTGATPTDSVTLRVPDGTYALEDTALDDSGRPPRTVVAKGGALTLSVSPAPLYVVPVQVEGGAPR